MFHVKHTPCQYGLYVHVPFCLSRCGYCAFCSSTDLRMAPQYLHALAREAEAAPQSMRRPTTLYIGGGTPSALGAEGLRKLMEILRREFDTSALAELTVECNPDDVTALMAETLASLGATRVSMGAQSFSDQMLSLMRRRHSARQVDEAVRRLREAGIANISLDLIYGLPQLEGYSFRQDLDHMLELAPQHVSAYALSVEDSTPFENMVRKGQMVPLPDDDCALQYSELVKTLAQAGYEHYEVSNFARPGLRAAHNSSYWQRTPYLGLGPAAASLLVDSDGRQVRKTNAPDIAAYCRSRQAAPRSETELLTDTEIAEEIVMLRLRTADGLRTEDMELLGRLAPSSERKIVSALREGRLVRNAQGGIRIPEEQWFVSDAIICSLV